MPSVLWWGCNTESSVILHCHIFAYTNLYVLTWGALHWTRLSRFGETTFKLSLMAFHSFLSLLVPWFLEYYMWCVCVCVGLRATKPHHLALNMVFQLNRTLGHPLYMCGCCVKIMSFQSVPQLHRNVTFVNHLLRTCPWFSFIYTYIGVSYRRKGLFPFSTHMVTYATYGARQPSVRFWIGWDFEECDRRIKGQIGFLWSLYARTIYSKNVLTHSFCESVHEYKWKMLRFERWWMRDEEQWLTALRNAFWTHAYHASDAFGHKSLWHFLGVMDS